MEQRHETTRDLCGCTSHWIWNLDCLVPYRFIIHLIWLGFVINEPWQNRCCPSWGYNFTIDHVLPALGIIGGMGLFSFRPWARILVMIVSAMNCLNIPIGTAKGVYSIWVLMQKETINLFERCPDLSLLP